MKKYVKIISIVLSCLLLVGVGVTYAFFNYSKTGNNNKVIAGSLYLTLNEGNDSINLSNVFPESKEEARERNDNTLTFTVKGKNTSLNKSINYEIILNNGTTNNEKTRYNTKDLVFDLVEIGSNNEETYILDAVSYDDLNSRRVWVDKVDENTTSEVERTYRLRVWVSEDVLISDSDPNADYTTTEYKNSYASVKIAVEGDLEDKVLPLQVMTGDLQIENNRTYISNVIENISSENNEDTFTLTITSSNSNVDFIYTDNPVPTNISSENVKGTVKPLATDDKKASVRKIDNEEELNTFEESYTLAEGKKVTFKVYLVTINGKADTTDLTFVLKKNGSIIQKLVKHVNVIGAPAAGVPNIQFVNETTTYTGSAVTLSNLTITNSDNTAYSGSVTYQYYMDAGCLGQELLSAPVRPGAYSVKISAAGAGGDGPTTACANITINKKSLTPSITSCDDKVYDGTASAHCSLTLAGIVGTEDVSLNSTCTVDTASVADNKTVTCSSLSLKGDKKDNYTLSSESTNLSNALDITKASLTIKPDNITMEYGDSAPTYTYTVTGFVNNETSSVLGGTATYTVKNREGEEVTVDSSTPIGTYFITLSGLTSSDYNITYNEGTLIVAGENDVVYDCTTNGGETANQTESVEYGSLVDLSKTCSKTGWTFVGWNSNQDATTAISEFTMKNRAVTLYAIYRKDAITYTLTYNNNGATSNLAENTSCTIPAVYNNTVQPTTCSITLAAAPVKAVASNAIAQYHTGWTSSVDSIEYSAGATYAVSANTTMTAGWSDVTASILSYTGNNATAMNCDNVQCALDTINSIIPAVLSLDSTSGVILDGESSTIGITKNTPGEITCLSSNTSVATCSISGNNLIINSVSGGTATITVSQAATGNGLTPSPATYSLTVEMPTISSCPGCKFIYTENEYYYSGENQSSITTFIANGDTLVDNYKRLNMNHFLGFKFDGSGNVTNAYACGIKGTDYLDDVEQNPGVNQGTAFCIEGSVDNSIIEANGLLLNDSTNGIWQGRCNYQTGSYYCYGSVNAKNTVYHYVDVFDDVGLCEVDSSRRARCLLN